VEKIAIIVPTLNYCNYVRQTLESVAGAIDYLRREPDSRDVATEVIVIDDGSTDGTRALLEELTRGKPSYQLILRDQPSSPSTVRNLGASISSGDPIFFLDGDDLFLENHLHECLRVFRAHPDTGFVKSHVSLSDPVHPEWITRINNSLVNNLSVRRRCHEQLGGFPDFHLFRRTSDRYDHELDIFRMIEDVFYNKMLSSLFIGRGISLETVKYLRHPGNSFDRQYERFQAPPGPFPRGPDDQYDLKVELAKALVEHEIKRIQSKLNQTSS
jgi:glycosyltransferase involved in cell wall biosynthesis